MRINSLKEMEDFAFDFSKKLKKGQVINLIGEMGSGKTTFTSFVCKYFGISNTSSPTFALVNIYNGEKQGEDFPIYHLDLYRFESPDEILELEKACKHFSKKVSEALGVSEIDFPYLGAGGGVSWALYIFFRAKISNSMELVLSLLDFQKLVRDKDLLIITENVDEFNGENSINLSKFAKRYNENIKIIFLQDEDYPNMRDNPYIDYIYKFKIKSNLERGDYEREIRSVARTFISDNLSQMENKFEKEELWLREKWQEF